MQMFDSLLERLVDPPFAKSSPFSANAKNVGLILAGLASITLFLGVMSMPMVLTLPGLTAILAVNLYATIVGAAFSAYGGYKMYREDPEGKRWMVYGLFVYFIVSVLAMFFSSFAQIFTLMFIAAIYYVVVTSSYPSATAQEATRQAS